MEEEYHWLNTPGYKTDYAVAGKPLHAVGKDGKSLCGLNRMVYSVISGKRESQWQSDLFNIKRCKKCNRIFERLKDKCQRE